MALPWENDPVVNDAIPEPARHPQQAMGRSAAAVRPAAPANDAPWMADDIIADDESAAKPYLLTFGNDDDARYGDVGFASKASNEANSLPPGAQEFQRDLQDLIGKGVFDSPASMQRYAGVRGFEISDEQAQAAFDATQSGQGVEVGTPTYRKPDISDVRNGIGDDPRRALLRGVPAVVGLDDEAGAIVDMLLRGGSWEENLARNRAIRDFDEENHAIARTAGTIAGGALLPSGAASSARSAAVEALRAGLGREAALSAARGALARTMATEGAAYGAAHGAGATDGSALDRGIGALAGSVVGGVSAPVLGVAGGKLFGPSAAGAAERNALTEGQEVAAAAARQGVDVLPADVGGPATRVATSAVAQTIPGAPSIVSAAKKTIEQAQGVRDRVAAKFGQALRQEGAGQTAKKGARSFISRTSAEARKLYDEAENAAGGASVPPTKAIATLDRHIAELSETPGGANGLARLQALRDELAKGDVTVRGMRNMRTALNDEFAEAGLRSSDIKRRVDQVTDAAAEDVISGLQAQGKQGAAQRYRVADRYWRNRVKTIDEVLEPIIGKNNDKSGEKIVQAITSDMQGNNARAAKFLRSLPEEEQGIVRASIISNMGRSTKGTQNAEGDAFSLSTFLTNWNEIGDTAKLAYFGKEGRAALNDLAMIAEGTKAAQRYANHSNTGGALGNLVTGLTAMSDIMTFGKTVAGEFALGRLLASPRFARWLARAPRKPNAGAERAHLATLTKIAQSEPAIAADVLDFQAALQRAMASPAATAAAEEEKDVRGKQPKQEGQK